MPIGLSNASEVCKQLPRLCRVQHVRQLAAEEPPTTYVGSVGFTDTAGRAMLGQALPAVRFGVWVVAVRAAALLALG